MNMGFNIVQGSSSVQRVSGEYASRVTTSTINSPSLFPHATDHLEPFGAKPDYYVTKSIEVLKNDGNRLLHEEPVTWLGKLFDYVFLGKRTTPVKDVKSLPESVKASSDKTTRVVSIVKSTEALFVNHEFKECGITQECEVVLYANPEEIGASSNNPAQFASSYPNCILQRVVGLYFSDVEELPSTQACGYSTTAPQIFQEIWPAGFDVMGWLFNQQESVQFSSSLMDQCYQNNLFQVLPTPLIIQTHSNNLTCATGSANVLYPAFFCNMMGTFQGWELTLPSFDKSVSWPSKDNFIESYCECSLASVENYFKWVTGNATQCTDTLMDSGDINYPLWDGSFLVKAPNGALNGQVNISFDSNAIEQCFNQNYGKYKKRERIFYGVLGTAGGIGVLVLSGAFFRKYGPQIYDRYLRGRRPAVYEGYDEL